MLPRFIVRQLLRTALVVVAAGLWTRQANAAIETWAGGTSGGTWSVAANWNPSGVPANTSTAVFGTNGTNAPTVGANATIGELMFSGTFSSSFGGSSTLTINPGNGFTGISDASSSSITFNVNLSSNNNQTWTTTSTGSLTFGASNTVNLNNFILTLTPAASTTMTFAGVVLGTGGITQNGSGTTIFTAANTYSGVTTISSGTLQIGNGATGSITSATVTDNGTLAFNRTGAVTYAGVVSGTGVLVQEGTGTAILTGANTYSGATSITAGTLQIGAGSTTGSITSAAVTDNGALTFNRTNTMTYAGVISGTGVLIQGGTGTTALTGANTYSGATSITAGLLQIGAGGTAGSITSATITDNAALAFNRSDTNTYAGVISGTGVLIQAGTGTLVLTGASTYSGATSITAGKLQIGDGGTGGSITSAAITDNAALAFNQSDSNTYGGVISGTGVLIQAGTGILTLTGANTYSGATSITAGTLRIGDGATAAVSLNNSSGITDNGALIFANTGSSSYIGVISGTGSLTQTAGTLILKGVNTYSGDTTISGGMLQVGVANAIGSSSDVIVTGTLNLNSLNDTVGSISGTGAITLGSGFLTQSSASTTTFAGVISGTNGGLVQNAASGTLVLTGANTYSGGTSITAGTLQIGNGGTAGSITSATVRDNGALAFDRSDSTTYGGVVSGTGVLIQAGTGILTLTGANTYSGATSITAGTLRIGDGTTAAVSLNNSSAITDNGALIFANTGSSSYIGVISGTGSLTQTAGTLILKGVNTYSGDTTISGGMLQVGVANAIGSSSDVIVTGTLNLNSLNDAVGSISGTGAITLGSGFLTQSNATTTTFAGVISGTNGGLVQNAASGTLVLTGANTYSGGTSITAGTLQIGNGGTTGSITSATVRDNGALAFDRSDSTTYGGVVSGTGVLIQAGTGILTLTGANTYSGATSITAGTLRIGDGITAAGTLSNSSAITDNGALIFANTGSSSYGGVISGTGSLTQTAGTLILKGVNTYSGDTTISGGMLQVGVANAIGSSSDVIVTGTLNLNSLNDTVGSISGTGAITLGSGFLTQSSASTTTFAGVISGTNGGLVQNAASGTLVLTGANTYSGGTSITAGTLQIGNGGTAGSITSATVRDNGALAFDRSDSTTYGGVVSGTGVLIQAGTGILTLTGANTYSGATSITAGTLSIGDGGAGGSIANTSSIVDNGALIVNQSSSSAISGVISGSGQLVKAGTGTLTLTGANTYAGGTTIAGGALQLGNGGTTGSVAGNITDNSALIFNRSDAVTESGVISGSGTVTQAGTGTTLVTGTNTYTGGTNVNSGTLITSNAAGFGAFTSAVNVQSGATLGLTGGIKIGGTTTQAMGLLTLNSNAGGGTANLTSSGGVNSWEGDIKLLGNASVNETAGGLLYLGTGYLSGSPLVQYYNDINLNGFTLNLNASGSATQVPNYQISPANGSVVYAPTNIFIQSPLIEGTGGLNVTGPGTVTMLAMFSNSYTGPTTVTSGTLIVDGPAAVTAIPSASVVVGSVGGSAAAVLQTGEGTVAATPATNFLIGTYNSGTQTASTSMTIYQNGTFNMNNGSDALNNLTMVGGTINEGAYSFNTLLTLTGSVTGVASSTEAVIKNGNVGLGANAFKFDIGKGSTSNGIDMEIDGEIAPAVGFTGSASADGLVKTGGGTLMFQGNNIYAGITDIQQGILAIQSNTGLGQAIAGSTNNGTVVASGAQLQLQQNPGGGGTNLDIAAETVTLAGTGISNDGALLNASGNNTWSGNILINGAASIDAAGSSSLNILATTLGSTIINGVAPGANLTTGGAGLITVNGGVGGQIGSIIQNGTGTTVLAGIDSYTGGTTVSSGALRLTNNQALAGSGVQVVSGATLQLAQNASGGDITEVGVATTLNGTGNNSGNGAFENVTGNNTYNGAITLGSPAQINADTGSNLRLTGGVTNGGNLLTVAGGGNTTISSAITGTGGLTMAGTGTLTLSSSAGTNTFSGVTSVASGALTFGANNQLKTTNNLAIATGAIVNVTDTIQSINTFTGTGTLNFGTSNANSQVTINGADLFSGAFTGTGTIIIPTGASLTLGNNFNDPNLNIILAGGSLFVNGTSDTFGTLTVTQNSILDFAVGTVHSVIDFVGNSGTTGGVVISTGVTLSVNNWVDTVDYFYSTNQPGVRFQVPLNQIVFDLPTWQGSNTTWLTYADGPDNDHQITPIPEPATYGAIASAFALALTGAYAYRRRRSARA